MRHRKAINHLGRTSSHRKAMMSNMATSLIIHKRIKTTLAKAKALRIYVEPLITRSKEDTTHNRREVFSYLQDNKAVTELFRVVSQKVADRPGGYTRILKLENRLGDNAQMCFIELVDFNELYVTDATQKKGAKRTRRAGSKKVVAGDVVPAAKVAEAKTTDKTPEKVEDVVDVQTEEVVEEHVEEVVEEPIEAVVEEPIEAVVEEPAEEVVEEPAEEVVEEPVAEAEVPGEEPAATDEQPEEEEKKD